MFPPNHAHNLLSFNDAEDAVARFIYQDRQPTQPFLSRNAEDGCI